jgi:hypothetical protein
MHVMYLREHLCMDGILYPQIFDQAKKQLQVSNTRACFGEETMSEMNKKFYNIDVF